MPKFSDFTNYIPGVNFYSGTTGSFLKIGNSTFISGYILAPYLSGLVGTSGTSYKVSYADNIDSSLATFDGVDPQVIGAVVVGDGFQTVNARTYIFVAKDSSSNGSGTKTLANGDSIRMYSSTYQNSY
jgi:hypothetical protein